MEHTAPAEWGLHNCGRGLPLTTAGPAGPAGANVGWGEGKPAGQLCGVARRVLGWELRAERGRAERGTLPPLPPSPPPSTLLRAAPLGRAEGFLHPPIPSHPPSASAIGYTG